MGRVRPYIMSKLRTENNLEEKFSIENQKARQCVAAGQTETGALRNNLVALDGTREAALLQTETKGRKKARHIKRGTAQSGRRTGQQGIHQKTAHPGNETRVLRDQCVYVRVSFCWLLHHRTEITAVNCARRFSSCKKKTE